MKKIKESRIERVQCRRRLLKLETVHLQLIGLGNANFGQKLANVVALIALQLNHFTILGVIDHGAVTGKLLRREQKQNKDEGQQVVVVYASGDAAASPLDAQ